MHLLLPSLFEMALLLPLLSALAIKPTTAAPRVYDADATAMNIAMNTTLSSRSYVGETMHDGDTLVSGVDWDEMDRRCGIWDPRVPGKVANWHHPRRWWTPDWKETIDYNWWPPYHPPIQDAPHYWANQVTGHVREYPCGEPMYRSTTRVYDREIPKLAWYDYSMWPIPKEKDHWDIVKHPEIDRQFWQNNRNESVRWTDPLNPHRSWSTWIGADGEPFWMDDFTGATTTEEPPNANWSITLRSSRDCEDDESVFGVIRHPIVNGCYPLDAHGQLDLGSGSDRESFRYKGSFTIYPGPCKIRVFKSADCPSEDDPWLTHDPSIDWAKSGRLAAVKPEEGPTCFALDEAGYAYSNASGTMSVPEEDKSLYCRGDPEADDPRLPQGPGWPEGLGGALKEEMNTRWRGWLRDQYGRQGVREDSRFGRWLAREVPCRKNAESARIQKGLSKGFAPSVLVACPADDMSQWWRGDAEP